MEKLKKSAELKFKGIENLPEISNLPEIDLKLEAAGALPEIGLSLPEVGLSLPEIDLNLPEITIPTVEFNTDNVGFNTDIKVTEYLSEAIQEIGNSLLKHKSIFLTGQTGIGKTYAICTQFVLLKSFRHLNILILSPSLAILEDNRKLGTGVYYENQKDTFSNNHVITATYHQIGNIIQGIEEGKNLKPDLIIYDEIQEYVGDVHGMNYINYLTNLASYNMFVSATPLEVLKEAFNPMVISVSRYDVKPVKLEVKTKKRGAEVKNIIDFVLNNKFSRALCYLDSKKKLDLIQAQLHKSRPDLKVHIYSAETKDTDHFKHLLATGKFISDGLHLCTASLRSGMNITDECLGFTVGCSNNAVNSSNDLETLLQFVGRNRPKTGRFILFINEVAEELKIDVGFDFNTLLEHTTKMCNHYQHSSKKSFITDCTFYNIITKRHEPSLNKIAKEVQQRINRNTGYETIKNKIATTYKGLYKVVDYIEADNTIEIQEKDIKKLQDTVKLSIEDQKVQAFEVIDKYGIEVFMSYAHSYVKDLRFKEFVNTNFTVSVCSDFFEIDKLNINLDVIENIALRIMQVMYFVENHTIAVQSVREKSENELVTYLKHCRLVVFKVFYKYYADGFLYSNIKKSLEGVRKAINTDKEVLTSRFKGNLKARELVKRTELIIDTFVKSDTKCKKVSFKPERIYTNVELLEKYQINADKVRNILKKHIEDDSILELSQ